MRRLVPIVLLAGCAAEQLSAGAECFRLDDCADEDGICFLAQCVDPGFEITSLSVQAVPPSATGLLDQVVASDVRLEDGYQSLMLTSTIVISGVILDNEGEPVPGTVSAVTPSESGCTPPATGRQSRFTSNRSSGEFTLRVPTGVYALAFAADDAQNVPPLELTERCGAEFTEAVRIETGYPALTRISGRLRQGSDVSTGFVADANVTGTGVLADGTRLPGSVTLSDNEGRFELVFAGDVRSVDLEIGPTDMAQLVPVSVFPGLVPDGNTLSPVVVGLGAPVNLVANLAGRNEDGTASGSVSDARLVIEGEVGSGILTVAADAVANQGEAFVRPGSYEVLVIPRQTLPFAITAAEVDVPDGVEEVRLSVVLDRRITVSGRVTDGFGEPVDAAQVEFRSRQSPIARAFSASTDADGRYTLSVDPPVRDGDAEYEVSIEPPRSSTLPLQRELVRIAADGDVRDFQLNRSSFVFGQVLDPDGNPATDVLLNFFSNELELEGVPLFVGSALADSAGEFALPVPVLAAE